MSARVCVKVYVRGGVCVCVCVHRGRAIHQFVSIAVSFKDFTNLIYLLF